MLPMKKLPHIFMMLAILLSSIILIVLLLKQIGVAINLTSSMPRGVYWPVNRTQLQRGDFVAVCLPSMINQEGLQRHYLQRGDCPGGAMPVIKQVIGIPGDDIELTRQGITINGTFVSAPIRHHDHNFQAIRQWVKPSIFLNIQGVWLYGMNNPERSWDSRYYGVVPVRQILRIYRKTRL